MVIHARYTLIKLYLLLRTEKFGCNYQGKSRLPDCNKIADSIKKKNEYLGYLAYIEISQESENPQNIDTNVQALQDLVYKKD